MVVAKVWLSVLLDLSVVEIEDTIFPGPWKSVSFISHKGNLIAQKRLNKLNRNPRHLERFIVGDGTHKHRRWWLEEWRTPCVWLAVNPLQKQKWQSRFTNNPNERISSV